MLKIEPSTDLSEWTTMETHCASSLERDEYVRLQRLHPPEQRHHLLQSESTQHTFSVQDLYSEEIALREAMAIKIRNCCICCITSLVTSEWSHNSPSDNLKKDPANKLHDEATNLSSLSYQSSDCSIGHQCLWDDSFTQSGHIKQIPMTLCRQKVL